MKRWYLAAFAALAVLVLAAAPRAAKAPPRPAPAASRDIVLITIDTLRADALGFAGNAKSRTPVLDRLAAQGRVFPNAHAHNVVTLPSHTNILTGLYPFQHGVRDNTGFRLAAKYPTLATVLHGAGYATGAFVGAFPLDSQFGLNRGFDVYDDHYPKGAQRDRVHPPRAAGGRGGAAGARLVAGAGGEAPLPLGPPLRSARRLRSAGALRLALQGQPLSRRGGRRRLLPRAAARAVPRRQGEAGAGGVHRRSRRVARRARRADPRPVRLRGHAAGAAGRLGARRRAGAGPAVRRATWTSSPACSRPREWRRRRARAAPAARSLLPPPPAATPAIPTSSRSRRRSIAAGRRCAACCAAAPSSSPCRSPRSTTCRRTRTRRSNLFDAQRQAARNVFAALPRESEWPPKRETLSPDDAARLASLGYISGSAAVRDSYGPEDDPKRLIGLDQKVHDVIDLYMRGKIDDSIRLARDIVRERPTMSLGHSLLAQALLQGAAHAGGARRHAEGARPGRGLRRADCASSASPSPRSGGRPRRSTLLKPLADKLGDPQSLNAYALALSESRPAERGVRRAAEGDRERSRQPHGLSAARAGRAARRAAGLRPATAPARPWRSTPSCRSPGTTSASPSSSSAPRGRRSTPGRRPSTSSPTSGTPSGTSAPRPPASAAPSRPAKPCNASSTARRRRATARTSRRRRPICGRRNDHEFFVFFSLL